MPETNKSTTAVTGHAKVKYYFDNHEPVTIPLSKLESGDATDLLSVLYTANGGSIIKRELIDFH